MSFRVFLIALCVTLPGMAHADISAQPCRRVVIMTDIDNEPDDAESMVRFLTYANEFEVEGLIATTSIHLKKHPVPSRIREIIGAYAQVRKNLLLHEPGFPTAQSLLSVVSEGPDIYGMAAVGDGQTSPGAEAIIEAGDRPDPRPLWILIWGGPNTLAQALDIVRSTRSPVEVDKFVKKLRVYAISDQDDSGPWIRQNFPDLFYIVSPGMVDGGAYHMATWSGISGDHFHGRFTGADFSLVGKDWLQSNVMSKGPLGAAYPPPKYLMEGDTPSVLYLIDNGLGDPEHPNWGSWGGRYEFYQPPMKRWFLRPETRPIWTDAEDEVKGVDGGWHTNNKATVWRWRQAFQNDFAARMDWTTKTYAESNHPPVAVISGADHIIAAPGDRINLNADGSHDPDGNTLSYRWFVYGEAGAFTTSGATSGEVAKIENADQAHAVLEIPSKRIFHLGDIHVILSVTDNGAPALTRYKRLIITVQAAGETSFNPPQEVSEGRKR